jgi:hypothetical protein
MNLLMEKMVYLKQQHHSTINLIFGFNTKVMSTTRFSNLQGESMVRCTKKHVTVYYMHAQNKL